MHSYSRNSQEAENRNLHDLEKFKYKMIFTDIDGTLLNKNREISEETKAEVKRITKDYNIPFVLVSSRMPKAMQHLQEMLGFRFPIISYNGALVIDQDKTQILLSETIPFYIVKSICEFSRYSKVHVSLYRNDNWYVEKLDYWANREINNTKVEPEVKGFKQLFCNADVEELNMHKIMCMGEKDGIDKIVENLNDVFSDELNIYRSKDTYLEITSNKVSKASAVKLIQEKFGFNNEEIIAIGDNYNDKEMLVYAGLGVAMGNANKQIKKIADEITLPNSMNGVAAVIRKYF